ncbi:MAG: PTS sugar transporter subunit IIA, partial [Candidatus Aminicenantes bacterium]|nr:PTS sugar transporter subunit IIA [Candidatus Aminicenantes bacterium]
KNENERTIIFTDMFGGSPTNICYKFKSRDIEIITGINLPGLLKFLTHREKKIAFNELVKIIKKGAINDINIISEYLGEKRA